MCLASAAPPAGARPLGAFRPLHRPHYSDARDFAESIGGQRGSGVNAALRHCAQTTLNTYGLPHAPPKAEQNLEQIRAFLRVCGTNNFVVERQDNHEEPEIQSDAPSFSQGCGDQRRRSGGFAFECRGSAGRRYRRTRGLDPRLRAPVRQARREG